jgi:hypothetical protein
MAYYKPVFDERQFPFEVDGEPVGACFGQPDWTPLFRSFNGRMGAVQIARYMRQAKRVDRRRAHCQLRARRAPWQAHRARRSPQRSSATTRTPA